MTGNHPRGDDSPPDFLLELRREYTQKWPQKRDVLRALLLKCTVEGGPAETLQDIRNQFHRLVGSGATYGFPEVTELARHAEGILDTAIKGTLKISEADKAKIEKIIVSLDESFSRTN